MPLTDEDFVANKENEQDIQITGETEKERKEQLTDVQVNEDDLFEIFDDLPSLPVSSLQATSSYKSSVREEFLP